MAKCIRLSIKGFLETPSLSAKLIRPNPGIQKSWKNQSSENFGGYCLSLIGFLETPSLFLHPGEKESQPGFD